MSELKRLIQEEKDVEIPEETKFSLLLLVTKHPRECEVIYALGAYHSAIQKMDRMGEAMVGVIEEFARKGQKGKSADDN